MRGITFVFIFLGLLLSCNVVDKTGISPGFFQGGSTSSPVFSFKAPVTDFYGIPENFSSFNSIPGTIKDIAIDQNGNIFIATDRGLAISQDDGTSWVLRNKSNGFASSYVHKVHVHSTGRVFFIGGVDTSSNGYNFIGYFDNDPTSYTQLTTTNGLENNRALEFYEASNGRFFIFGPLGISMTTDGGNSFSAINTGTGLATNYTYDIYSTGNNIYVGGFGGVSVSTDGGATFTGYTTGDGLGGSRSEYIFADSAGNIYASHNIDAAGVSVSTDNGATWAVRTTADGLTINNSRGIFEPVTNKTVVGFTSGVPSETNNSGTSFSAYTTNDRCWEFFKFGSVIFCGANNNFEISTDNGSSYTQDTGGLFSSGSTKVVKKNSSTYFSVNSTGLTRFDTSLIKTDIQSSPQTINTGKDVKLFSDNAIVFTHSNSLMYSSDGGRTFVDRGIAAQKLFVDSSDNLYVATGAGLRVSSNRGVSFITKNTGDGLPSNVVRAAYIDSSGDWYVATQGGLAFSTDGGTSFVSRTTADGLIANDCADVAVDSTGRIFVAHNGGVSVSVDGGTSFTSRTTANGIGNNTIKELFVDSSDNIYVGNVAGLSISIDNGANFTNYNTGNGLPANNTEDILVTNTGIIYSANSFGSSGGISQSSDGGTTFTNAADVTLGLPSDVVYEVEIDSSGYLYVLTNKGVATNRPF